MKLTLTTNDGEVLAIYPISFEEAFHSEDLDDPRWGEEDNKIYFDEEGPRHALWDQDIISDITKLHAQGKE